MIRPNIKRSPGDIDPRLRDILNRLLRNEERWPLYLFGQPGRGKTCAGLCVFDYLAKKDPFCVGYSETFRIMDSVTNWKVLLPNASYWGYLGRLFFIIDEVAERSGQLEYDVLKRVADLREHTRTIWISNHSPEQLGRITDARITSRLCMGTVAELKGRDRRGPKPEPPLRQRQQHLEMTS